jgi:hypothetical protein
LIASALCSTVLVGASAATLERTSDGRIILTALGERLAFREQDAARIGLRWPSYPCKPIPERGVTLALWLQDPAVATCLDAAIPTQRVADHTKSVTLRAVLAFENGDPYPGGRRITEPLGSPLPLYPGDIANAELPNPPRLMGEVLIGIGPADLATQCYRPPRSTADDLGYRAFAQKSESGRGFYLREYGRRGGMSRPLCVLCSRLNAWTCSIKVLSEDRTAFAWLQWLEGRDGVVPNASWTSYDAVLRKIAQSIFIDRPSKDLQ